MSAMNARDNARPAGSDDADLLKKTLRTTAVLVGACVVFVGALSALAVAVTSRATAPVHASPSGATSGADDAAKKPLSI